MSEIITASAVRFNALPTAHDGYTLLYEDNRVCQSDVKLSELVGDMSAYLTEEKANTLYQGKGDYLSASTSANFYPMTGNPSGFLTSEKDWTDTIKAASANAVNTTSAWVSANYYNIEEINDFLDEKYDTSSFEAVSGTFLTAHQDLSSYYTKQETSAAGQLSAEFEKYMEIPIGLSADKQYGYTTTGWSEIAAGGATYNAGQGIKIENDTISIKSSGCSITGTNAFAEGKGTSAHGNNSHAEGFSALAAGMQSHAEGNSTVASNSNSHAEGRQTKASGLDSHSEGSYTSAFGDSSHVEGYCTLTSGEGSHAEGMITSAIEQTSHAEGKQTIASGKYSHSEGYYTSAFGEASHAEGISTLAAEKYSHAEGEGTIAASRGMHAGGMYNKTSAGVLYVIGKGSSTLSRSDAFIINGSGGVSAADDISANGVKLSDGDMKTSLLGFNGSNEISSYNGYTFAGGGSNYSYITVNMPNITPSYDFTYVQIGNQKWMNSNLTIDDGGSGYIEYSAGTSYNGGSITARNLYTYEAAKRIADGIPGWHLPTYNEVKTLFNTLGHCNIIPDPDGTDFKFLNCKYGKKLKSQTGWPISYQGYENGANGTDDYGFKCYPLSNSTAFKDYEDWCVDARFWCYEQNVTYEGETYVCPLYIYLDNYNMLYQNNDYVSLRYDNGINAYNVRLIKDEE